MKRFARFVLSFAVLVCIVGCERRATVIPSNYLIDIYADMFLADQWISRNEEARRQADTTLLYDAVFAKYGYTRNDYYKSVDYYLDRPEEFRKITVKVSDKLKAKNRELVEMINLRDSINKLNAPYLKRKSKVDFSVDSIRWNADALKYMEEISKHIIAESECNTQKNTDTLRRPRRLNHSSRELSSVLKD